MTPENKRCESCAHAMASQLAELVFCIAHPPVPIMTQQGVVSHFPMLMRWAKCDEFKRGEPQTQNEGTQ